MIRKKLDWKLLIGILVSILFLYLAFRKVDFSRMLQAFATANYLYLIPVFLIMAFCLFLRVWRWKYLLAPLGNVRFGDLFSALMIGYMANVFIPAHLGELLRAFVIGKKTTLTSSAVFATIVVERIIDVFSLLFVMAITIIIFPFPQWVQKSGYITFLIIILFSALLIVMKKYRTVSMQIFNKIITVLPSRIHFRTNTMVNSFLDGVVPLKNWKHYILLLIITLVMWASYALVFNISFLAFDFPGLYSLPWYASLVLLVLTTISIAVPSSPGYVGTYHYLCQIGLAEFFNVPADAALSFAFLAHGINMFPVFIAGLIFASREGLALKSLSKKPQLE